jgi:hypothetical protein
LLKDEHSQVALHLEFPVTPDPVVTLDPVVTTDPVVPLDEVPGVIELAGLEVVATEVLGTLDEA